MSATRRQQCLPKNFAARRYGISAGLCYGIRAEHTAAITAIRALGKSGEARTPTFNAMPCWARRRVPTMEFKRSTLMQIADMICGNFNNARQFQQCQE
jgi:hypothetical protein